ncbi:YppE family protein [Bacillus sp. 165]|uniref:YppE family protein n=1 Tax=Bacillus sp. 165 TaxID=1529117 RepID=UPI001AD9A7EB|nr:YppE family protein [Bacillus sp. 165]
MTKSLGNYTTQLLQCNENIVKRFERILQEEEYSIDFYGDMKPFIDEVDKLAERWKAEAEAWIVKAAPKYLHISQVQQTYDNIKNNALDAFSQKTKEKRFKQTYQAIKYVLESMQQEIKR